MNLIKCVNRRKSPENPIIFDNIYPSYTFSIKFLIFFCLWINRIKWMKTPRDLPTLSLFTGVSCVANGNKSKTNIFLYFVLFCARFYLPLDLSLHKLPKLSCFVCLLWANKNYFSIHRNQKSFFFILKIRFLYCLWSDFVTCQSHCEYTKFK